jgi:hypothetical protein
MTGDKLGCTGHQVNFHKFKLFTGAKGFTLGIRGVGVIDGLDGHINCQRFRLFAMLVS